MYHSNATQPCRSSETLNQTAPQQLYLTRFSRTSYTISYENTWSISRRMLVPKHSGLELMKTSLFSQQESHLQFLSGAGCCREGWGKIYLRDKTFFCASTRKEVSNLLTQVLGSQPSCREQGRCPARVDSRLWVCYLEWGWLQPESQACQVF